LAVTAASVAACAGAGGPCGTTRGRSWTFAARTPWNLLRLARRPAHLHFRIQAEGCATLVTHVFRRGDPQLASNPGFGVRDSLVADWPAQPDGGHALAFDFVLQCTGG
jgi:hydroxyquinol 1,2-dioxygenase